MARTIIGKGNFFFLPRYSEKNIQLMTVFQTDHWTLCRTKKMGHPHLLFVFFLLLFFFQIDCNMNLCDLSCLRALPFGYLTLDLFITLAVPIKKTKHHYYKQKYNKISNTVENVGFHCDWRTTQKHFQF